MKSHYGVQTGPFGVTRLPCGVVLKSTTRPPQYEVQNMRFVARNTFIPVPTVYDFISFPAPVGYISESQPAPLHGIIVMSFIEGETLMDWIQNRTDWPPEFEEQLARLMAGNLRGDGFNQCRKILDGCEPALRLSDSQKLLEDLRNAIRELRSLPPPSSGAISGLNDGPLIWSHTSSPQVIEPFEDINAFHEMLLSRVGRKYRLPKIRRLADPVHTKQHRICFTHADLHQSNILVRDGQLAGIIDWEFSGWYPEYWEWIRIRTQSMRIKPILALWDAVGAFTKGEYRDERILHYALLSSAGDTAVPDEHFVDGEL